MLIARKAVRRSRAPRGGQALALLVATTLLGLAVPAPTVAAQAPATDVPDLCAVAASYNDAAQPAKALALIDRARESRPEEDVPAAARTEQGLCSAARSDALTRIDLGKQLGAAIDKVGKDEDLAKALPGIVLNPDSVTLPAPLTCTGEQAEAARKPSQEASDGESAPTAPDPVAQLLRQQAQTCDANAVVDQMKDEDQTVSQSLAKGWKTFTENYLSPMTDPLLGALGFLATGVVLALLLVWPLGRLTTWWYVTRRGAGPPRRIPRYAAGGLRRIWAGAVILVITAALVLLRPHGPWLLLYGLAIVVGACLLGWGLSQSARMRIKAADKEGAEDHNASAHIAGLIRELCRSDFRSLETAGPAEDSSLQATGLTTTPEGKVAAAAYKILELLVPRTPWMVRVQEESADLCAVTVQHHGKTVSTAVVDRDLLGLRTPIVDLDKTPLSGADDKPVLPDLHRACAAVAVAALASRYTMDGLDGASTWEGIGLHFVARTDLRYHDKRSELLERAVESDPDNQPALLQLWHARFRDSTKPGELELYADFLDWFLSGRRLVGSPGPRPGLSPTLRLRACYARYIARLNAHYASRSLHEGLIEPDRRKAVNASIDRVRDAINATEKALATSVGDDTLADRVSISLAPARAWRDMMRGSHLGTVQEVELGNPWAAYSWACFYASRAERRSQWWPAQESRAAEDRRRAVRHLAASAGARDLRDWASKDPQLGELVKSAEYREEFGRAAKDTMLEVEALTPHKEALTRIGATNPEAVLQHGTSELGLLLKTTAGQAGVVRRVAQLALSVPPDLDDWRYELTDLLSARGILTVRPGRHGDLVDKLAQAMEASLSEPPTRDQLADWLGQPPAKP